MTPRSWGRVRELFELALQYPPNERSSALAAACRDSTILDLVRDLLESDERAGHAGFLDPAPEPVVPDPSMVGRRIGPYQIREQIGSGGMGCVYRATRIDDYEQVVALKLVRPGAESDELLRRFRTEQQALADLNHPNIARLLDGGVTDYGAPYFVMEYLAGLPLHRYCDDPRLDTASRLRLFHLICLAVEHAHQRGVVHRDLKPDNILVTSEGTPKVTDFGLAKLTDRTGGLPLTETGGVLGSPSYMAPEQAIGSKEIGPSADVYSLGAILYELLTGRPPFRAETLVETLMRVLNEEPLPPRRLNPALSRDLETICLTALHKVPARRYASAAALADDVARALAGEPVRARSVTLTERLWRHCRRRPLVAGLLAALTLTLIGGFGTTLMLWIKAEQRGVALQREKEAADRQRDHARRAVDDMYTRVAERWLAAEPHMQPVQREFLQKALDYYQELARENGDDPQIRHRTAQAHFRMGNLLLRLTETVRAVEAYQQAIEVWLALAAHDPNDPRYPLALFHSRMMLANALSSAGHPEESLLANTQALAHARDLVARFPDEPLYWDLLANHSSTLGQIEASEGRYAKAEVYFREGLALAERLTRQEPKRPMFAHNVAINLGSLGRLLMSTSRVDEAIPLLRRAVEVAQELAASDSSDFSSIDLLGHRLEAAAYQIDLGGALTDAGRPGEAEATLREAVATMERIAADRPTVPGYRYGVISALTALGHCYRTAGRTEDAVATFQARVKNYELAAAEVPTRRETIEADLASELCTNPSDRERDPARALSLARATIARSPAPEHWRTLGIAAYRAGDLDTALTSFEKCHGIGYHDRLRVQFYVAMVHHRRGDPERAKALYQKAVSEMGVNSMWDLRAVRDEASKLIGTQR